MPHKMRGGILFLLLFAAIGAVGSAEQAWEKVSLCSPGVPFTFCEIAEGNWSLVRFDEEWSRLSLMSRWGIDIVAMDSGEMVLSLEPPSPWMTFTGIPAFSPDGGSIACPVTGGPVWTWDVETGETMGAYDVGSRGTCVAFSHDGTLLATQGAPGEATVWSTETGELLLSLSELTPYGSLCVLGFDVEDTLLFVLGSGESGANATGVWDLTVKSLVRVFPGTAGSMSDGTIYALEPGMASGGPLTYVTLWDDVLGAHSRTFLASGRMFAAAFSRDGRYMALALAGGIVSFWDLSTQREVYRLDVLKIISQDDGEAFDEATILVISISPDGSVLGTGTWTSGPSRAYVHLWNVSELLEESS